MSEETHLSAAKLPLGAFAIRLIERRVGGDKVRLNCGDWG